MDNSTLPPLFDNMDNVDISSPSEEPEIFQSAIQVSSFVFLIAVLFWGLNLALFIVHNFPISHSIFERNLRAYRLFA